MSDAAQPTATRRSKAIAIAAAVAGVLAWLIVPRAFVPVPTWAWVLVDVGFVISLVPRVAGAIAGALHRLRNPSPRKRAGAAMLIAVVASLYLFITATRQGRDFFPKSQDDQSYVIQMRQLARGRLWMPQHPLADFFDSFHVIVRPVYASAYFPGTALMFLPVVWLGLPVWVGPIVVAGAIVGLTYRVITELVDGVAALLAALLIVSPNWFRMLSIMVMAQLPALLLGLILVWAWLRWRASRRIEWAVVIGAAAGWMTITRPVDAIAFIVPVGVAMLLGLREQRDTMRRRLLTIALVLAGAAPFVAVQLIQNVGITGHLTQTAFGLYIDRDQPQTSFGFHRYDPSIRPASPLPQKQRHYDEFVVPFIRKHTLDQTGRWVKDHLPQVVDTTMPARALLVLVPVGLIGVGRDRRRWVLVATVPVFLGLYFCYTFFLEHYAVTIAPAVVMLVVLAPRVLREAFGRVGQSFYAAATFAIVVLSLSMLPELNHDPNLTDEFFRSDMMRVLHDQVPQVVQEPAVILFRYDPNAPGLDASSPMIEPVYNTDVAWPDDAPVIRVHDLGPRDAEIFDYYARRQPQRTFYLFDRGHLDDPLHLLGNARDLAARYPLTSRPTS